MYSEKINYGKIYDMILMDAKAKTVSYGISQNYVPKWTEIEAGKEYVANFYDENGVDFSITIEDGILILEDKSERGIVLEDLAFGNSRSQTESYKIGTHGEGFKLGALALIREGKKVLIETIGHTIVFYLDYEEQLNSLILKSKIVSNNRKKGTLAYLEVEQAEKIKEMFLFLNENYQQIGDILLVPKDGRKNNQIFVNTLASQAINDAQFSYSLWKKQKINRDRNMIASPKFEIAKSLLMTKSERVVETWLESLEDGFETTFEGELIQEVTGNFQKKPFKGENFEIWKKTAEEKNIVFLFLEEEQAKAAYRFASPDKKFIFSVDYRHCLPFFTRVLGNYKTPEQMPVGRWIEDKIAIPLYTENPLFEEPLDQIRYFIKQLRKLKILKKVEKNENILILALKNLHKVDWAQGKIEEKETNQIKNTIQEITQLLYTMQMFSQFNNWKVKFDQNQGFPVCMMEKIPETLELEVFDPDTQDEMNNDVNLTGTKSVLTDLVYDTKDGKCYEIKDNQLHEEIEEALFSYKDNLMDFEMQDILSSAKIVKEIMRASKNSKVPRHELNLISKVSRQLTEKDRHSTRFKEIKKEWTKQFQSVYGMKACVSTMPDENKRAQYCHYQVIQLQPEVKNMMMVLDAKLSSHIKGAEETQDELIEKPILEYPLWGKSEYYPLLRSVAVLHAVLEEVFSMYDEKYQDPKYSFLMGLLPNGPKNKLFRDRSITLKKQNASTVIKDYVCEILENTSVAKTIEDGSAGYVQGKQIVVRKNFKMGTFFHEYVHLATGLLDLDKNFEKYLSFISLMAKIKSEAVKEREIHSFFKYYAKWRQGEK